MGKSNNGYLRFRVGGKFIEYPLFKFYFYNEPVLYF